MAASSGRGGRASGGWSAQAKGVLVAHPHRTAAGIVGLLVFAYLWPALVGGRPPLTTGVLATSVPWRQWLSPELLRFYNLELADVACSYHAWDVLARQLIRSGTFPAWNPHASAGTPLFANDEVAWLSPFTWPLWVLSLNYGFGVVAALKLWVAGFGTYLLVRELRLGFWPAIVAAISFTLCAFNIVWLTYGVFVSVAALLPWALWLVERIVRRGRSADGPWLALVVALILTGGHPGTQVHVLAATVLFLLVRIVVMRDRAWDERVRGLLVVSAGVAAGALVAAVVLVPTQRAAVDTFGAFIRRDGAPAFPGSHIPFDVLRTALVPDWWGRPIGHLAAGGSRYRERTFYAGAVPLVLAALALVSPGGWRRKAPFVVLIILGAAVPLRMPVLHPLVVHMPLFNQVQNQRMLLWFVFGIAVLAAFGVEDALAARGRARTFAVLAAAALAGIALALPMLDRLSPSRVAAYVAHRTAAPLASTAALASATWWLIFLFGLAVVLALARWRPLRGAALGAPMIAVLVALDLLHFAHGYNPMGRASLLTPPRTPAIAYLQRHAQEGRIAAIGDAIPGDWSTVYGLRDVRGYDAPQPSLRFASLWFALHAAGDPSELNALTPESAKLVGLLGGRYILLDRRDAFTSPDLAVAYAGSDAVILRDELAVRRAFVPGSIEAVDSEQAEIAAVAGSAFDPRFGAVVRSDDLGGASVPAEGSGTARVVAETNASVTLEAKLRKPGLVVLDDQLTPGWTVSVDGHDARALRTDVVLRGVIVPAGRHRIEWRYSVPGLRAGAALSALGLLGTLAWMIALRRARRRQPGEASRALFSPVF
jgi:hypothetical protein